MNGKKQNLIYLKNKEEIKKKLEYSKLKKITQSKLKELAKEIDPVKKLIIEKSSLEMLTRSLRVEKRRKILNPFPINKETVSSIELSSIDLKKSIKFPIRYINIHDNNHSDINNSNLVLLSNRKNHSKGFHLNTERNQFHGDSTKIEKRLSIINNECLPQRLRNTQHKTQGLDQNKANICYSTIQKENYNLSTNTLLKTFHEPIGVNSFSSRFKLRPQEEIKNYEYTSEIYPKIRTKYYNYSKKLFGDIKQPAKTVTIKKSPEIKNIMKSIEKLRKFRLNLIEDKYLVNISNISMDSSPENH